MYLKPRQTPEQDPTERRAPPGNVWATAGESPGSLGSSGGCGGHRLAMDQRVDPSGLRAVSEFLDLSCPLPAPARGLSTLDHRPRQCCCPLHCPIEVLPDILLSKAWTDPGERTQISTEEQRGRPGDQQRGLGPWPGRGKSPGRPAALALLGVRGPGDPSCVCRGRSWCHTSNDFLGLAGSWADVRPQPRSSS